MCSRKLRTKQKSTKKIDLVNYEFEHGDTITGAKKASGLVARTPVKYYFRGKLGHRQRKRKIKEETDQRIDRQNTYVYKKGTLGFNNRKTAKEVFINCREKLEKAVYLKPRRISYKGSCEKIKLFTNEDS